jgi:pilus assembly protein CpaE
MAPQGAPGGADPRGGGGGPPPPNKARLHRIIAVYSPKGGVGRSVIACNLAVALKKLTDLRVCLVDADLQSGDAHVLLNINAPNTIDDLREAAGGLEADVINSAVAQHDSGVELLRAPIAVESAELFTADAMKAILVEMRDHFDYLIIDTDDALSEATLTVLEMADPIVLVSTLEVTTINKVTRFFEVLDRLGYSEDKVKLICNRVEAYYGIRPPQVETQVRHRFISQIPEDNRLVVNSVNRGVPFVLTDRRAPVSRSIQSLAERVVELSAAAAAAPEMERGRKSNRGGFGR